jgi:hypothetical protein
MGKTSRFSQREPVSSRGLSLLQGLSPIFIFAAATNAEWGQSLRQGQSPPYSHLSPL